MRKLFINQSYILNKTGIVLLYLLISYNLLVKVFFKDKILNEVGEKVIELMLISLICLWLACNVYYDLKYEKANYKEVIVEKIKQNKIRIAIYAIIIVIIYLIRINLIKI